MKKMFPRFAKNIMTSKARNVFEIATLLYDQGYTDIVMVVGSDRVKEFDSLLKKYDGEEGRHGFYEFSSITVVSAGDRDPDAEGVEGMSASKMRAVLQLQMTLILLNKDFPEDLEMERNCLMIFVRR